MGDLPGSPSVAPSPPFLCGAAEPVEDDTRRVGKRFESYIHFCRNSDFGGTRGPFTGRPRELHGAPSVAAELTPFFFSISISLVFFLPFLSPLRSSAGSPAPGGAGGAAKSGKRASSRAEPLRIGGHGWAPCPARGSAVSLEEGEGARSLRVRSYQR
jgi:hypothetical protein